MLTQSRSTAAPALRDAVAAASGLMLGATAGLLAMLVLALATL